MPTLLADIVASHEGRLRSLDPLLPETHPLPESGEPILVRGGAGVASRTRVDLDDPSSIWRALDEHRLLARVGADDPIASMNDLLTQWQIRVRETAAEEDADSAVVLPWPSRDVVMTRLFLGRGLVPLTILAARPACRPRRGQAAGIDSIRPCRDDDLDAMVALHLEEVRWDQQFGQLTERSTTPDLLRKSYAELLERNDRWTWIAEVDGRPRGLLRISPPEQSEWIAPTTRVSPAAYLDCMVVSADHRGAGLGSTLVATAHEALDEAGVGLTLLHYGGLNPLSGPFWHRCGYRSLWTFWELRPASRLR